MRVQSRSVCVKRQRWFTVAAAVCRGAYLPDDKWHAKLHATVGGAHEAPVSIGELIVLDGSRVVSQSLLMLSKAVVSGLQIDAVTLLS